MFGHGETRSRRKVDKEKKRYYEIMAVLQSLISPWKKGKGKNRKKKPNYYNTGYSDLVTYPNANPAEQGLTSLSGRNMCLVV